VTEPELIRQRHIEILRHFPGSCMQTCAPRRNLMLQANTLYGPPELGSQERKQLLLLLIRQCIYSGFDFGQCTHVPNVALQQSPANNGQPQRIANRSRYPQSVAEGNPSAASLLVDFRDPNSKGEFVYRCHILEHEDCGMMGKILVNY
jgi:hypothetical protein